MSVPRTLRILCADDTESVLEVLAQALEDTPYEVDRAATGPEVLVQAHGNRPDLILLDIHLPVLGGLKVLELLSDDPATAAIPVIALDSVGEDATAARALAAGAAFYLQKPVSAPEARAVIRRLVARP